MKKNNQIMKTNFKNKNNKKSLTFITTILVVVLILFIQQYIDWKQNFQDFRYASYMPASGIENISTNWRYFMVYGLRDTDEVLKKVDVEVNPKMDYKVVFLSEKQLYEKAVTNEELQKRINVCKNDANRVATVEECESFLDTKYSSVPRLTIEHINQLLEKNTRYQISFTYKKFNIFDKLLNKNNKLIFTTNESTMDELTLRRGKILSAFGSFMASPPSQAKKNEERVELCPYSSITFKFTNVTKDYLAGFGDCSIDDKNLKEGEEVKVIMISKDFEAGKVAFRTELAKYGLKESPTMRVNYTHEPKTEAEIKKLLDENKGN